MANYRREKAAAFPGRCRFRTSEHGLALQATALLPILPHDCNSMQNKEMPTRQQPPQLRLRGLRQIGGSTSGIAGCQRGSENRPPPPAPPNLRPENSGKSAIPRMSGRHRQNHPACDPRKPRSPVGLSSSPFSFRNPTDLSPSWQQESPTKAANRTSGAAVESA